MIGFKYTNIKIQTAYIKFMIYSYLHNLFLLKPGFYFQFILTEFSRDSLSGEKSKEQFNKFINDNIKIVDVFYEVIEQIVGIKNSNKMKKYIWLTCVLNKDIKTNFNLLSDDEIEKIGRQEVINLMFDTFFIVLGDIQKKYKIQLQDIKSELYEKLKKDINEKALISKTFTKFDGSIENLIDSCFFIENIEDVYNFNKRPLFVTYPNNFTLTQKNKYTIYDPQSGGSSEVGKELINLLNPKFGDVPTQINELLNQDYFTYTFPYNDFSINTFFKNAEKGYEFFKIDLNNIVEDVGYKGLSGQVFFKIKDQVDVQFRCGSEASKNPITLSFRDSKRSDDFIYVQKFFEPGDKSYLDLEQFIFVRYDYIKSILKNDKEGTIELDKNFDTNSYTGIKFIEGKEIYDLENNIRKSNLDIGFLALIPIKKADSKYIKEVLNSNYSKMIVGTFSEDQRNLRMSYGDLTRIFCKNWIVKENDFSKFYEDTNKLPKVKFGPGFNIDLDDIIDCYFSVYFNEFNVSNLYRDINTYDYTAKDILDFTTVGLLIKTPEGTSLQKYDFSKINNKEGTFSLLLSNSVQKKLMEQIPKKPSLFLQIQKKFVTAVKIGNKNKKIFVKDFKYNNDIKYDFSRLYDYETLEKNDIFANNRTPDSVFLEYLKKEFMEDIVEFMKKNTSEEEKEILLGFFPALADPQNNLIAKLSTNINLADIKSIYNSNKFKNTRAYKNMADFINYYKNSVESLAKELQDNV